MLCFESIHHSFLHLLSVLLTGDGQVQLAGADGVVAVDVPGALQGDGDVQQDGDDDVPIG